MFLTNKELRDIILSGLRDRKMNKPSEPRESRNLPSSCSQSSRGSDFFEGRREMARGYNGYSKSNRALQAEADGKMTASVLAKRLKVSTAAVKEFLKPCEYHHTSGWFNCTDYYDEEELLQFARGEKTAEQVEEDIPDLLAQLCAFQAPDKSTREIVARKVSWLEWSGSRAHPKATERSAENVKVTLKGQFAVLHLPSGDLRKKITAHGFSII